MAAMALTAKAQIFIPGDPVGSKAVYERTNSEGKTSRETLQLERVVGNRIWISFDGDQDAPIPSMHYTDDAVSLSLKELDGLIKSKMPEMVHMMAKIKFSGDFGDKLRFLPLRGRAGQAFKDQTMNVRVDAGVMLGFHMKLKLTFLDDQILRTETAETPFGRQELLVRRYTMTSDTEVKILGKRERETEREEVTQWIIPGRGVYKEETRDGKGKLTETKVLLSFTKAK